MAEGSKAADLSSVLSGGVGSNPTSSNKIKIIYYIYISDNGVVVIISASQADDRGSIPRCRIYIYILKRAWSSWFMTTASHAVGPEFDSRSPYIYIIY